MRIFKTLLFIFLILLIFISCEKKISRKPLEGTEGGDIVVGIINEPENLSPLYPSFTAHNEITDMLFLPLHKKDKDGNIIPMLAKSWEYSEDLTKITYNLRQDIVWQDGTPFTAKDVVFTFNAMKNPKNAYPLLSRLQYIDSVKAIDDYKVVFYFSRVYPMALYDSDLQPIPEHILSKEKNIQFADFHSKPIGNGPYKLKEWKQGKYIELVKNEKYSLEDKPFINKIIYKIFDNQDDLISAIKKGEVDIAYDINPEREKEIKALKNVRVITKKGNTYTYLGFNLTKKPFDKKELRIGISKLIDRKSLIKKYVGNNAIIANGPLTPSFWAYSDNVKPITYNKKEADSYLSKVLKKSRNKYYLGKKQFSFTIITDKNDLQLVKIANAIANQISKNGIKVKVKKLDSDELIIRLLKRDYDAYVLSWTVDENFNPFPFWSSNKNIGTFNLVNYKNPEIDKILNNAVSTMEENQAFNYWEQFQKTVADDAPYAFLYIPNRVIVVNNNIKSFDDVYEKDIDILSNLDIFYVEQGKQKTVNVASLFEQEKKTKTETKTQSTKKTTTKTTKKETVKKEQPKKEKKTAAQLLSEAAAKSTKTTTDTTKTEAKTEEKKPVITIQPSLKKLVQPIYPESAKKLGVEGMVFVKVTVGTDGKVKKATILKGLNPAIDAEAIKAAKQCLFKAGTVDGVPTEMETTIPFRFTQ